MKDETTSPERQNELAAATRGSQDHRHGGESQRERHEPVITETGWNLLQTATTEKTIARRPERAASLLVGIIRCSNCGDTMQHQQFDKNGRTYMYVRCAGYMTKHNGCNERVRGELIEQAFVATFLNRVGGIEVKCEVFQPGSDNTEQILNADRLIDDLEYEKDLGLIPDRNRYVERRQRLVDKRAQLGALDVRPASFVSVGTGVTYGQYWATADRDERRRLLLDSEIVAYAGRALAFGAAQEAVSAALGVSDAAVLGAADLGPDRLGNSLRMVLLWSGTLAERFHLK